MNFKKYAKWVNTRWAGDHGRGPIAEARNTVIAALGLAGETGEVVEHFKKHVRDGRPLRGNAELVKELGDVLHYWVRLCHHAGVDPEQVMAVNVIKLERRDAEKKK